MLEKIEQLEIIKILLCYNEIGVASQISNIGGGPKISMSSFMGNLKEKSILMIYDRHPELQSKWDKVFWAIEQYVKIIGNITDEAVQKYIKERAEESMREDLQNTDL